MTDANHNHGLERLIQDIAPGARLLRTWPLRGGSSAQMTPFEIALPGGGTRKLILRRPSANNVASDPRAATSEFKLLQLLQDEDLPTAAPCHLDRDGQFIVIEYLDGEADYGPADRNDAGRQLADCLAVLAIATYIHETSQPFDDLYQLKVQGEAARGRTLFRTSGCLGCHSVKRESMAPGDGDTA